MPSFTTPTHESNDCHNPAGSPAGGQFCSGLGGAGAVSCGPAGECFANVNRWNARHGAEDDRVVHGKVTNIEGKRFDHAWVERGDTVIDPTAGVTMPKAKFYELMDAKAEASYSSTEAVRNQIRARHHGPWTEEDLKVKKKAKKDDWSMLHAPKVGPDLAKAHKRREAQLAKMTTAEKETMWTARLAARKAKDADLARRAALAKARKG